ncbi:hypothetical protein [Streptomyces arenae]|uniref:hypothetical protein n=1 Tax=Streptomyces arenae TaxID=29301 RepID=UPI00265959A9|nr:hypothetical protein [Streptomyces arenae]MCG7204009.1 hypothetical protein [Streptomyces arenae]
MTGRKATRRYHSKLKRLLAASAAQRQTAADEGAELRRLTPEEVVEKQLLPYRSVRVLKQRCYERKVHHHLDGGRITFTLEDLRREAERTAVEPFSKA